jgi:hypothetical protein
VQRDNVHILVFIKLNEATPGSSHQFGFRSSRIIMILPDSGEISGDGQVAATH